MKKIKIFVATHKKFIIPSVLPRENYVIITNGIQLKSDDYDIIVVPKSYKDEIGGYSDVEMSETYMLKYIYEKNYSFWQKLYLFWTKVIIRKYSCFYYLGIDFFLYNLMPVIIKAIKQSENDTKKAICIPYKNKSSLPSIYPLTLYPAFWVIEE